MKNSIFLLSVFLILLSCDEETSKITFKETGITLNDDATIEINYPKASGNNEVSDKINSAIETAIAEELSFSEEITDSDLDSAINTFSKEFILFRKDFPESQQAWEAIVDSEVIYQSPEVISISISTYIDTGGAHGNTHVIFLNFDPNSGEEIAMNDLITNENEFRKLAIKYFKQHLDNKKHDLDIVDSFYGKDFQLPETIGLTDEGVVLLYNTYEIAAYSFGITEFIVPFEDVSDFISRR